MTRFPHLPKLATFSFPAPTTTTKLPSLVIFHSKRISTSSPYHSHAVPSLQHITQLILDQKSPSQVLQTFKWASNLPNFTHSQSTYRAVVHKLCSFRHFDSVHQLLEEMPSSIGEPPDEAIFITIIRGLGRVRMIRQVVKVLDLVCKFGRTPSLKVFNSILDVLVKEDIDLARTFYRKEMMESGVKGDDYTFGILMKGLCLTNRIGDGFKLLQVIKSSGSKPNTVVYNTLLFALCKNGKIGRARSLMNEMEAPNDVTFNVLISGYCKENNLVQALVMLEKCFSSGLMPDIVTVTKVVEVLCNAGRVTEAVELLERVESRGGKIDVIAYNTLIKGFCRVGKVKVGCGLLKEMERKGCLPNVDTYNALISGFCESGMLDLVLDLFNEMQMDGIHANFTTYDVMIKGLFSGGRMEDGFKILALMEEMKGGSGGYISPYNSVLYGLYKKNLWDEALDFLMKMEQLFPRAVNQSLRIMDLCEQGAIEDAKKVYNQMTEEGGSPSILVYDCLIHGFCIEGRVPETFDLINEMVGRGYLPVASALKAIICGLCTQGKNGCALKLIEEMVGKGCIPDAESYSPIIHGLCRKGNLQDAFVLFLQIVEMGITPDCSTWNSLLLYLSREVHWSEPKDLFRVNNLAQFVEET